MSKQRQDSGFLHLTRLVEEVPEVDPSERYYLWRNRQVEAHFATAEEGEKYCAERGITIDQFEAYEP